MKALITGFQPFGSEDINPSYEAVKLLPSEIGGLSLIKLELPVEFNVAAELLRTEIIKSSPDFVICLGQAGGRASVSVEKIAINLIDAVIPDNAGSQPSDVKVKEDGENAYFSLLPVKAIVSKIREAGIQADISYSAGTYVCNEIMYQLLYMIDREFNNIRGGFIHVPYTDAQIVDKRTLLPHMPLKDIAEAVRIAVEVTAATDKDISSFMGKTH